MLIKVTSSLGNNKDAALLMQKSGVDETEQSSFAIQLEWELWHETNINIS